MVKFHPQKLKKEIENQNCKRSRKKIHNFTCFADEVKASELNKVQVIELDLEHSCIQKHDDKSLTVEDIVRSTTGSKSVTHPILETGTNEFIHKDNMPGRRLVADSSTSSLIFPRNGRYVCSSETFVKNTTETERLLYLLILLINKTVANLKSKTLKQRLLLKNLQQKKRSKEEMDAQK